MVAESNLPAAKRHPVQFRYSPGRTKRLPVIDRVLVALFLVVAWQIPYPFRLAVELGDNPGVAAALNGSVSARGFLLTLAWAAFGLLIWFRVNQTGRIGFLRVLANLPGLYWMMFILVQMISILFSPGPMLCMFRVYQSVVLTSFLIYWFYYEGGRSGSALIRAFVAFSATNALYDVLMYVIYPDAVMSWNPVDGNRLIGGWLFPPDFSSAGLVVFTFCLVSLLYCRENWRLHALGLAIGATNMVLSATRGVTFSAITVACLAPWLRARNPVRRAFILVGMAIVLLLIFIYANQINELLGRSSQSIEGLDGRQDIWATYVGDFFHVGSGSVVFGLGYLTGGRFLASRYGADNPFGNLHNMYLEALVDVGFAGLFALVACLVMLLLSVRILRRWQTLGPGSNHDRFACRDLAFCWLSLIAILILGMISTALLDDNGAVGMTMVLAYLLVCMSREPHRVA